MMSWVLLIKYYVHNEIKHLSTYCNLLLLANKD